MFELHDAGCCCTNVIGGHCFVLYHCCVLGHSFTDVISGHCCSTTCSNTAAVHPLLCNNCHLQWDIWSHYSEKARKTDIAGPITYLFFADTRTWRPPNNPTMFCNLKLLVIHCSWNPDTVPLWNRHLRMRSWKPRNTNALCNSKGNMPVKRYPCHAPKSAEIQVYRQALQSSPIQRRFVSIHNVDPGIFTSKNTEHQHLWNETCWCKKPLKASKVGNRLLLGVSGVFGGSYSKWTCYLIWEWIH